MKDELLALEAGFWQASGDPAAYERHVAPDAVHVFPGWGVAGLDRVLDAVGSSAPWESFELHEPRLVELGAGAAALVYTAHAVRDGEPYDAAITSVYRRDGDGWKLAAHQQTPLEA